MAESAAPSAKAAPGARRDSAGVWRLYLLECSNGAYYAGITNDLARRYAQHLSGKGAKYTRANPPRRIVGSRDYPDRAKALAAEYAIRRLPPHRKVAFVTPAAAEPCDDQSGAAPRAGET